jgi:Spy/CpxP family protein refolding chaperone
MINTQNKSKIFVAIIVMLMIANIVLVSLFLLKKDGGRRDKHEDRKAMITQFLKNEIGFSTEQLQRYDTLSDNHRDNIKKMFDSLRSSKDKQFKQLAAGNFTDSVMNSVAEQSAVSQKLMELQMFNHLKSIRSICTAAQLPKFDSLFVKVLNKRGGEGRKKDGDKR